MKIVLVIWLLLAWCAATHGGLLSLPKDSVVTGEQSWAMDSGAYAFAGAAHSSGESLKLGDGSSAGRYAFAGNGSDAVAAAYQSAAISRAQVYHHYCIVIGDGAVSTTNNQLVIAVRGGTITAQITTGEWATLVGVLNRATETPRVDSMFDRVFDAICAQEDSTGEYIGRVHRDGVSYGRCGITQVAVQDCIDAGYLPPGVYDLTNPAMADWCGRQYLRLLVARWGSLWAATCHWNARREAYAAKVWGRLDL